MQDGLELKQFLMELYFRKILLTNTKMKNKSVEI
jgi:hypothetical protein